MTVSVVIPAYNGSRFLERAILSALDQQRQPDEILVCDDNSSDSTLAICQRYKDRISIRTNPKGPSGFVPAWNRAIASAKGEWITILHQDDMLAPQFLRLGMAALERNAGVRHLFSICHYIDEKNRILSLSYHAGRSGVNFGSNEFRYTGLEYVTAYQTLGEPHIHRCPGVITHRSIFEVCRYEPAAGHIADDDFFYRVGMYTDVIGILIPLASFRVHNGSATGRMTDTHLARQLMYDYIYQCRQWKGDSFLDRAAYDYFVRHARKYIRRSLGYGIKEMRVGLIVGALRQGRALKAIIGSR